MQEAFETRGGGAIPNRCKRHFLFRMGGVQTYFWGVVLRVICGYSRVISRVLWDHFGFTFGTTSGEIGGSCWGTLSVTLVGTLRSLGGYPEGDFWGIISQHCEVTLTVLWGYSANHLEVLWGISLVTLRVSWGHFEGAQGITMGTLGWGLTLQPLVLFWTYCENLRR